MGKKFRKWRENILIFTMIILYIMLTLYRKNKYEEILGHTLFQQINQINKYINYF